MARHELNEAELNEVAKGQSGQCVDDDPAGDHKSTGGPGADQVVRPIGPASIDLAGRAAPSISAGGPQAGHPAAARPPAHQRPSARASAPIGSRPPETGKIQPPSNGDGGAGLAGGK